MKKISHSRLLFFFAFCLLFAIFSQHFQDFPMAKASSGFQEDFNGSSLPTNWFANDYHGAYSVGNGILNLRSADYTNWAGISIQSNCTPSDIGFKLRARVRNNGGYGVYFALFVSNQKFDVSKTPTTGGGMENTIAITYAYDAFFNGLRHLSTTTWMTTSPGIVKDWYVLELNVTKNPYKVTAKVYDDNNVLVGSDSRTDMTLKYSEISICGVVVYRGVISSDSLANYDVDWIKGENLSSISPVQIDLRTVDWSGNILPLCNVTISNVGSKISNANGWANFTNISQGTYTVNVFWKGSKVNQTTLIVGTTDVNLDVKCHVWGLFVNAKDGSGKLLPSENTRLCITFPNRTHAISSNLNPVNYKLMNGTYYFAVKWQNSWVYGNTSVYLDVNTPSIDLSCKVYSLQLDFKDDGGRDLYSDPTSYSLTCPNGSKIEGISSFNFDKVQNGTHTISDMMWQGSDITPVLSKLTVSSNTLWTLNCRVYDVDLQVVDRYNYPIGNSRVEVRLTNGTTRIYTSNSSGFIPHIYQLQTGQVYVSCSNETKVFLTNKPLSIVRSGLYVLKSITYQLTIQALDSSGNPIVNQPIEITFNNGTKRSFNLNGTGYWSNRDIPDGTMSWSIHFYGTKTNSTTIDLQKDSLITSRCQVYPLTLSFLDSNGTSSITPSSYSLTLQNGTIFTGRTILYYPQIQTGEVTVSSILWKGCDVTPVDNKLKLSTSTKWDIKCKVCKLLVTVTDPLSMAVSGANVEVIKDGQTFDQGITDSVGYLSLYLPMGEFEVRTLYRCLTQTRRISLTSSMSLTQTIYLSNSILVLLSTGAIGVTLPVAIMMNRKRKRRRLIERELVKPKIEIAGGYEVYGEYLRLGIKVSNHTSLALMDATVILEGVPEALEFQEPQTPYFRLGNIRPNEFQSAVFKLKPTRCIDGKITGIVSYYDIEGKRRAAEIPPTHIRSICPFLTSEGVVIKEWNEVLKGGLIDVSRNSFSFEGSPKLALSLAEERVRNLILIERSEKIVDDVYCGYACYFGQAKYGGYMFATEIHVTGTETKGQLTITVYSSESAIVSGFISEIMEDIRKHIKTTSETTVLTGKCPECGGELDPLKADETGTIRCSHCRCLNVIPPWMRVK